MKKKNTLAQQIYIVDCRILGVKGQNQKEGVLSLRRGKGEKCEKGVPIAERLQRHGLWCLERTVHIGRFGEHLNREMFYRSCQRNTNIYHFKD